MAVRRSLAWTAFGQGSFVVLQFIGSVVVARLLGPYDTGVFAVAMAAVGLISVIQALGLNSFLVREPELTPDIIATTSTVNLVIASVMALGIAATGLVGGALFDEPGVRDVLLVIAAVPLIGHFAFIPQTMLEREGDFRRLALIRTGSTALGVGLTVALAFAGYRYMSLAYSQVATALITNIAINLAARRHINLRLSVTHWSRVAKFGAQIFAISGLTRIAARTSELVLGRTLGLAALGLYSRASSNHNQLWDGVHGVVTRVFFVDFARMKRAGEPIDARYLKILELMTGLLWPLFAGLAILAGPLVGLVYGDAWLGAAAPLALLCVASMLLVSTTMAWEIFVISNETARQVRFEFIRTAFSTTLFVAACFHSLEAAAATRIADGVFAQLLYRRHLERMTGAAPGAFMAVYRRSALAAVAAVLPAAGLMAAWRWSPETPLLYAVGAALLGGALWLLALRHLNHAAFDEITRLWRRFRPKPLETLI